MDGEFEKKVVLVTGGSTGIGRATAIAFAKEGAIVVIASRHEEKAKDLVAKVRDICEEASFMKTDVSCEPDVGALVTDIVDRYGRLDCAFNNAGAESTIAPFHEQTLDDFDKVIDVDLRGTFLCMKYEITEMLQKGDGRIVNTAAIAGFLSSAGSSTYSAAKAGIIGLTRSAAVEYANQGLRINAICPGIVQTETLDRQWRKIPGFTLDEAKKWWSQLVPKGRFASPEEVADAVLWLCSDSSRYVTGHALVIDGGLSLQ